MSRRLNLVGVGATDKVSPSELELLPPDAPRFADTDPRLGAVTFTNAALYPAMVAMCEWIRKGVPQSAYLAPVPQTLSLKPAAARWRNTISALALEGGTVRVSCSQARPDDRQLSYSWLCLQYYLATMQGNISQEELYNNSKLFFAVLARQLLLRIDFTFHECSTVVVDAFKGTPIPIPFPSSWRGSRE